MTQAKAPNPYTTLFPLIREHLWLPDGKPPVAWDERREGSVLKRLLVHKSVSQIEVAILGLARLRESGQVSWLKPGAKVTCRALYNSRSGVSQMFELATREYWLIAKKRPKRNIPHIGEVMGHLVRTLDQGMNSERYRRYIRSPEWAAKRAQVLARASLRCEKCDRIGLALEVHHLRYDSLGFEPMEDLLALCGDCHEKADTVRREARECETNSQ